MVVWGEGPSRLPGALSQNARTLNREADELHPGPRRRDIPDKNFMQVAFFCCFRHGVAGMSRDLGRDVPDLEKLYARKLWADLSYPT